MGSSRQRTAGDGSVRYVALYRDPQGRQRSAGTFTTEKQAERAWHRAETLLASGRLGNPRRGRQTFRHYVEQVWLPNHELELTTRERYFYSINRHLMPTFGSMRMVDIMPEHVRSWVTHMKGMGLTPSTIATNKTILSAICTTALNDQVIFLHPCRGVKTPTIPRKPRVILTPKQFDLIYRSLPGAALQLLLELEIESGLRWGELCELRPCDVDLCSRILTVSRAAVEVNPQFHPEGKRFFVKQYPKDKEYRRFKISAHISAKLDAHIRSKQLKPVDLLFTMPEESRGFEGVDLPDPTALGTTEPNPEGRRYRHGTLTGYSLGRCRCDYCRSAYSSYRAERRSAGKDDPRTVRRRDTDGHIPRNWFRRQVWQPALSAAGLDVNVRVHDLRHAHASWLLAGGADLQTVKERLGHGSLRTTEKYLHTLPDTNEMALAALSKIRGRPEG